MIKKLFMFVAIMLAFVMSANAQSGSYTGTLHNIVMNGNPKGDQTMTFTYSNGYLKGTLPKIGSMPGTITINMPVDVDANGNLTTTASQVGTLSVLSTPLYLDDDCDDNNGAFYGTLTKVNGTYVLDFTLNVVGSFLSIEVFPASVSFTSTSFVAN